MTRRPDPASMRGPQPEGKLRLIITCDGEAEARMGVVLDAWQAALRTVRAQHYGDGLKGLCAVFMCRRPELQRQFKQRIRLDRKARQLYADVMLDLDEVRPLDDHARSHLMKTRLLGELGRVLLRYDVAGFDRARFLADLEAALQLQAS